MIRFFDYLQRGYGKRGHLGGCFLMLFLVAAVSMKGAAPSLTEYQIKGLFLVNFIKYVDWPEGTLGEGETPFVIGIIGDNPFDDELKEMIHEKTVKGRRVLMIDVQNQVDLTRCHLLFIAKTERNRIKEVLKMVGTKPILTVGEDDRFLEVGGMINFVLKNEKIRLEINLHAIPRDTLTISSRLLNVADMVKR